jgi:hypothetical protein
MYLLRLMRALLVLIAAASPAAVPASTSSGSSPAAVPPGAGTGVYPRRDPTSVPVTPPGTLYVDRGCASAAGADGTAAKPFCTISAAAAVVAPGQTVVVQPGDYNETVTVSRSGTATAPITFVAANTLVGPVRVGAVTAQVSGPVFTVQDVQHVVIRGFVAYSLGANNDFLIKHSTDITIDGGAAHSLDATAIVVTGGSSRVTVSRASLASFSPGIQIDPGSTGTVVTTNTFIANGRGTGPAFLATDAPGTVITSNTVEALCTDVNLAGTSPGGTVENNILTAKAIQCGARVAISVSTGSAPQTVVDYNLTDPRPTSSLVPYSWAGTGYPDQASFTTATGQGAHDILADPQLYRAGSADMTWELALADSALDSADANAPGELRTDQVSGPHADDPNVANTGTGIGYADRGAIERLDLESTASCIPFTTSPGTSPQSVRFTYDIPVLGTIDGLYGTFAYLFDDSPYPVIAPAGTIEHHFAAAGAHTVQVMVSTDGFTTTQGHTCPSSTVTVAPEYQRRSFS